MIIEISKIPPGGVSYEGEEPAGVLDLEPSANIRLVAPIRYDLFADLVGERLMVKGRLASHAEAGCCRCGEKFEFPVKVDRFLVVREFRNKSEIADLTEDIREDTILAFPSFPVCAPTCKGLCPHCGTNRNRGVCKCRTEEPATPWGGLDGLNLK